MFNQFFSLALICVSLANALSETPGRALVWTKGNSDASAASYRTTTMYPESVRSFVEGQVDSFKMLVLIKSRSEKLIPGSSVAESFKKGEQKTVLSYIYQNKEHVSESAIGDSLKASNKLGPILTKSATEISHVLSTNADLVTEKPVVYQVEIRTVDDALILQKAADLKGDNVLFMMYDEPTVDAFAPAEKGNYIVKSSVSRRLDETDQIFNSSSPLYKPAGAEYSIYYADQYLYITPDIFTGLMTALFFFFVLLIGTSCLGSIQGMSMFYDKVPAVGREA